LGHIDTVPGEIPVRQEGDHIYGRGSVDAKGPLAAFVDAVAETRSLAGVQLVIIGAVGEESDSVGARQVIEQFHPVMTIIGEPSSWDRITLGYKGSVGVKIVSQQAAAHSAGEGQSASEAVIDDWFEIKKWAEQHNLGQARVFDQVSPGISGMRSANDGFEESASLEISFRLPISMDPGELYQHLGAIIKFSRIEELNEPIPAYLGDKNNPLVRAFIKTIRAHGGQPRFVRKTGTSDMNLVAPSWKSPILAYGPGDSTLDHTPHEHISLAEYHRSVRILTSVLQMLVDARN